MTVYRLSDMTRLIAGSPPTTVNVRYFVDRRTALAEASRLADVYVAMFGCMMIFTPVDKYGIVAIWRDRATEPDHEIRIEKGEIEDLPPEGH